MLQALLADFKVLANIPCVLYSMQGNAWRKMCEVLEKHMYESITLSYELQLSMQKDWRSIASNFICKHLRRRDL